VLERTKQRPWIYAYMRILNDAAYGARQSGALTIPAMQQLQCTGQHA